MRILLLHSKEENSSISDGLNGADIRTNASVNIDGATLRVLQISLRTSFLALALK